MRSAPSFFSKSSLFLLLAIFILTGLVIQFNQDCVAIQVDKKDAKKEKKKETFDFSIKESALPSAPKVKKIAAPKAKTETLSSDRVKDLIGLLGPIEEVKNKAFVLPEQSIVKPKLPGKRIQEKFPPVLTGIKKPSLRVQQEDLRVARVSHTGKVNTIGQFTVTFSQPMVPIARANKKTSPEGFLVMKPLPKGTWRWLGTQTLLFEPEGKRFPRATTYKLTIPKGIKSISGGVLKEDKSWTITTPAPSVKTFYPRGGPQKSTPLIVAIFNQKINRQSVFDHLSIRAKGLDCKFKPVDKSVVGKKYGVEKLSPDQWIAIRPVNPLPLATSVKIKFGKGYQSLEGPTASRSNQTFQFNVYGPLKLTKYPTNGTSPDDWKCKSFTFNNNLDRSAFSPSMVTIKPDVPDLKFQCYGSRYIQLSKSLEPFTSYKVTFSRELKDVYGQTLGRNKTITFKTGAYRTALRFDRRFVTVPGSQKPTCLVRVKGTEKVGLTVYRVKPQDCVRFLGNRYSYYRRRSGKSDWFKEHANQIISRKTVKLKPADKEIKFDFKPYLKNGFGQFVIEAKVYDSRNKRELRTASWIQVTNLSIDAFAGKKLYALVSSLKEGTPYSNVQVRLLSRDVAATTNKDGIAELPLSSSSKQSSILVAKKGNDTAVLPANMYGYGGWSFSKMTSSVKGYGVTDRKLYKPGEKVKVKGWSRKLGYLDNEKIQLTKPSFSKVLYKISNSRGKVISKGSVDLDATGGFNFEFKIPEKINLGRAYIYLGVPSQNTNYLSQKQSAIRRSRYFRSFLNIPFEIQEFRRPEFEMKVKSSKGNSIVFGESTKLTAKAKYFAGGNLKGSPITWRVAARTTNYKPAGWRGFRFGQDYPYWTRGWILPSVGKLKTKTVKSSADANGQSTIQLNLDKLPELRPVTCRCEATIKDVNRQSWSDRVNVMVHPSDTYVGVKQDRWFYRVNDPIKLNLVAVDVDGKVIEGRPITIDINRMEQTKDQKAKPVKVKTVSLTSGKLPVTSELKLDKGGKYQFVCVVTDKSGRKNKTEISTYVKDDKASSIKDLKGDKLLLIADKEKYKAGDTAEIMLSSPFSPAHGLMTIRRRSIVETIPIEINASTKTFHVPVKEDYYPNFSVEVYLAGDKYRFGSEIVRLKVPPEKRRLNLSAKARDKYVQPGSDTTIEIELKDSKGNPVSNGQVALAVADEAVLALSGYKWSDPINVFYPSLYSHVQNSLIRNTVLLTENRKLKLNDKRPVLQGATNRAIGGAPYQARQSIAKSRALPGGAADMALGAAPPEAMPRADRNMVQLEEASDESGYGGGRRPNVRMRTNFSALALFKPAIYTDENGKAQVDMKLPDSLTRYRIMAVAVSGKDKFGSSESNITARLPIMVKPSPPRFLHFGDECELPIVLQNQTDKDIDADVVLRAANASVSDQDKDLPTNQSMPDEKPRIEGVLSNFAGKHLTIPANNRVEVRFPVGTIDKGKANFQCAVIADKFTDASKFTFPVLVPASIESFAAYGQIDKGAVAQNLKRPEKIFKQIGGLNLSTSSTAVQALTDAYFQLRDYKFDCSEQISSRVIAMVSLHDVLSAFEKMDASDQSKYRKRIQKDINELLTRQNNDGSFGLWRKGESRENRYSYVTIQVTRALQLARDNDFKIDEKKLKLSKKYLRSIRKYIPARYPEKLKRSIEARALSVRYLMGDVDSKAARSVIKRALAKRISKMKKVNYNQALNEIPVDFVKDDLPLECAGWLYPIINKDTDASSEKQVLKKLINASINETPSTASSNDRGYGFFNYCIFFSPRRTDAILLEALMETEPKNPLIPKLVKGLLGHRKNGTWSGTQENGYILQALNKYFNKYENVTPDFSVDTWLGDTLVANSQFRGRTTDTRVTSVPMKSLLGIKGDTILINKRGPGRLYYRLGLDYAPRSLKLKPADFGFTVDRTYEAVDKKDDVFKDKDGVWHFKAGALIKTKVNFKSAGSRYHIALADPLPAGTEPVNTALKGNRQIVPGKKIGRPIPLDMCCFPFWRISWYNHQNFRDHQAEAFSSVLYSGEYKYEYQIRATTPGRYQVPPTKVEEMYSPETFGRTASEVVIVE